MLEKLFAFLKRLFGLGTDDTSSKKPIDYTGKDLPEILPDDPQDGADIGSDTSTVEVLKETEVIELLPSIDPILEPPTIDLPGEIVITEPTENPKVPVHRPRYLWCLDNGHGKKTAGKRSPKFNDQQFFEYEFNRDVVKRMMAKMDEIGIEYFNVVPEVDVDNILEERVKRANVKSSSLPKLYLSIHSNAAPAAHGKWSAPHISGIETWYYHNNNRGKKMAAVFQKHLIEATGWKNRHIKSRPTKQFYVLKKTNMTAILTENGFYNNEAQCKELMKDTTRQKIAEAHIAAIMEIETQGM